MASDGCVNANYTAPVSVIGLYIAAGSSVCLVFMLFDILSAFHQRQRWIPCRLFSLNSITLTLLTICTKLPVDLTTAMPGLEDQLSKLTGTTVVCIAIGYVSPSLGIKGESEYVSNMAALSILVVTVVVNICIQISTGVIHQFVTEHITIMSCMLILLLLLWYSSSDVQLKSQYALAQNRFCIMETQGSMLDRLKVCYLYGFHSNPQLESCKTVTSYTIAGVCLCCSCVLIQATVRSVILKQFQFCEGTSDYDWSMWLIVVSQILVVLLGCFATSFRLFTLFSHVKFGKKDIEYLESDADFLTRTHPLMRASSLWHMCRLHFRYYAFFVLWIPIILIMMPATALFNILGGRRDGEDNSDAIQELQRLVPGTYVSDMWVLRKVANNINIWVGLSKSEPPNHLKQLLVRTHPSHTLHAVEFKNLVYPDEEGIEVFPFAMALIVKLASLMMPKNRAKTLEQSFEEAYEIIHFIDTRMNSVGEIHNRNQTKLTKAVLLGDGFRIYIPQIIEASSYSAEVFHSLSDLSRARLILKELHHAAGWGWGYTKGMARVIDIANLINRRQAYGTIEEVYYCMEQIFVDMLHLILAQLPNAIYKEIGESPAEEFEERVRFALKLWCKAKWLEDHIQWASAPTATQLQVTDANNQSRSVAAVVESVHDLELKVHVQQT